MRKASVICKELDHRVELVLVPENSTPQVGEVRVPGISDPVQIFLVPETGDDYNIREFISNCLEHQKDGTIKRSDLWRIWKDWHFQCQGENSLKRKVDYIPKHKFLELVIRRIGRPVKTDDGWVFVGYVSKRKEEECQETETPAETAWQSG